MLRTTQLFFATLILLSGLAAAAPLQAAQTPQPATGMTAQGGAMQDMTGMGDMMGMMNMMQQMSAMMTACNNMMQASMPETGGGHHALTPNIAP